MAKFFSGFLKKMKNLMKKCTWGHSPNPAGLPNRMNDGSVSMMNH